MNHPTCPKCKGTNLQWQEYVCHTRSFTVSPDQENHLVVDCDDKVEFEDCKDASLYCKDCGIVIPMPENFTMDFGS